MKARILLQLALALSVIAATVPAAAQPATNPPPAPRRPNIILILADDLGYGDLSCYGQKKFATPNLDKLASEGIRFTDFYAGSTVCSPSRATLMTGQHTGHAGIRGNAAGISLQPGEPTLASVLKNSGYRTCLLGKWGLMNDENQPGLPERMGFGEVLAYLSNTEAHDYYAEWLWRYDPPNVLRTNAFAGRVHFMQNAGAGKGLYLPDQFTDSALNFMKYAKPEYYSGYRPFFLFLSYPTPHANNEEGRRTGNGMQVPTDAPYSNEPWPAPEKNKAAMIARLDGDIGKIVARLKELKIDESTLILFTSDNGPHKEGGVDPKFHQSSGPFRGHKRDLTEGGIRVPLIARWPERIKPGQVTDFVSANWDLLPTFAEIARTEAPKNIDGISLLPLLTGREQTNRHDYLYWEFHERGFQQAVRAGEWKGIRPQADEKLELYNLKTDPGEKENVAEKNPEVVAKLEKYLKEARTESDRWPIKPPPPAGKSGKSN
jgi:arylsulfatase A-like enzyme